MITEKVASIIGPSYTLAFFAGGALGLAQYPQPKARRTYRLLVNNYLNSIGKTSSRFGNNVGAAILMYIILGKIVNFVFFEELEGFSESSKSALYGSLTGVLYKSTRGYRPMIRAAFVVVRSTNFSRL